ncbi:MAG TPA: hypothetical protein VF801_12300 [Rhodocyclaceae bacterium]
MARKDRVHDVPNPRREHQAVEGEPPAPAEPAPGKAHSKEELRRNREQLEVDERHKTPDMEKGHRGTFP